MNLKVRIIASSSMGSLGIPQYHTPGSAGMDLRADLTVPVTLIPKSILPIPTGIRICIPEGYEGQIRTRSGLSMRGIRVANAPGTIDSDFRGEIKIIVENFSDEEFLVSPGDRIAQIVFAKIEICEWEVVDSFGESSDPKARKGGFGSTGVN